MGEDAEDALLLAGSPSILNSLEEVEEGGLEAAAEDEGPSPITDLSRPTDDKQYSPQQPKDSDHGDDADDVDVSCVSEVGSLRSSLSSSHRYYACEIEEIPSGRWLSGSFYDYRSFGASRTELDFHSLGTHHEWKSEAIASSDTYGDEGTGNDVESSSNNTGSTKKKKSSSRRWVNAQYFKFLETKNKELKTRSKDEMFLYKMGMRRFTYKELADATQDFSSGNIIGGGATGIIYRGFLPDSMIDVAIKRFHQRHIQDKEACVSHVKLFSQLRHQNIVELLGWCEVPDDFLLIYEFMPNDNLFSYLNGTDKEWYLPWRSRYKIVLDIAAALRYLDENWDQCVVHGDIKSSNVLLDQDFNAKLHDFGATVHEYDLSITLATGAFGWMAPELLHTLKISRECDIYSFGIVTLEIACGRPPIEVKSGEYWHLVEWVRELYAKGMVLEAADGRLNNKFDKQQMERLLMVGIWCANEDPRSRPSIRQAIEVLTFEAPIHTLTLNTPAPIFSSPMMGNTTFSINISPSLDQGMCSLSTDDFSSISSNFPSSPTSTEEATTSVCSEGVNQDKEAQVLVDINDILLNQQETFDIGIPPDYTATGPLADHQFSIVKSLASSLTDILKSEPQFGVVMENIKKFTKVMVLLNLPLDDWNSLAQYVLRAVKAFDDAKTELKKEGFHCGVHAEILPYLLAEIDKCAKKIEEEKAEIQNTNEQYARTQREHELLTTRSISMQLRITYLQQQLADLQKQINDAENTCLEIQEHTQLIEARKSQHLERLDHRRRQYAIISLPKSIISKVSSFACEKC